MPGQHDQPTLPNSSISPATENGPVDGATVISRPSSGSAKGPLDLPAELRLCVFDFLLDQAPADLAALARTCKAFWLPASRALYKRITLDSDADYQRRDCQKLVRCLRLIHTLLLSDKGFLTMMDQLRINIVYPKHFRDLIITISRETSDYPDTVHLSAAIDRHLDQAIGRAKRHAIDWRDIVELILKRSPNLRRFDYFGHIEWDFKLDYCRKLEIIYLHNSRMLTSQQLANLAPIRDLKSLQLSSMRDGWTYGHFTFSSIPRAQFPSLVHLKILDFSHTATHMPDLITMAPALRSLEIKLAYNSEGIPDFISHAPLSSILNGTHRSLTRPKPSLSETLEKMRVHTASWINLPRGSKIWYYRLSRDTAEHEEKNVKMWNERFFGSLTFLRSLKLLEIPLLAPVHRIIHLLPESLEELHLTDENLFLFDLTEEFERISAVLPHLGPTAGLHNMKAVFLKFQRFDPNLCQHIMDRMKDICQEVGIKLNVVLNYVPESEWGLKEN